MDQPDGLSDFLEYTSGSSADATTFAAPNVAHWVQVIGAGSTVVVMESGTSRTITTDAKEPNALIAGVIVAFTSTTATRVRMGRGKAPAFANPPNLIAIEPLEIPFALSGSDGVLAEIQIPRPVPGTAYTSITAHISMTDAITASDTNYLTITVSKRNGSGGGATALFSATTKATGGMNAGAGLSPFVPASLGAPLVAAVAAGDVLTLKSVKSGSGQASGAGVLKLTYSVP